MVSISTLNPATIAAIFDDAGYVLATFAAAEVFALAHPTAAAYLGLGATISFGLANRINPTNVASNAAIAAAATEIGRS